MKCTRILAVALAGTIAAMAANASAAVLFSDAYDDAGSSGNYDTVTSDAASSYATYGWDYLANMGIPSAPRTTDGSTTGLKIVANDSVGTAAIEAITLHTKNSFSGDYVVTFDAWLNVNGPFPLGGSGSTKFLTAGVGGNGTTNNQLISSATNPATSGVGGWSAVDGDNGNGADYRFYKGTTQQAPASNQFAAGNAANARNGETNPYYAGLGNVYVPDLPVQGGVGNQDGDPDEDGYPFGYTMPGAFGMKWQRVTLKVDVDGGTLGGPKVEWYISGKLIGTFQDGFTSDGRVTLGYVDYTSNFADAPQYNFALIDNLQVVPEPSSVALASLTALGLLAARRRRS